jgi:hypothetical protein
MDTDPWIKPRILLKKITKTLGLGWFGVVYSWSLCILDKTKLL